jgi:uncharacterized protein YutE (UPF0331/DUF86 family)
MSQYGVLAARIRKELELIRVTVNTANLQLEKAKQTGDRDYLQAAALSLQNFYMGVERAFEEVAKQVDRSLPTGASSHRELLDQMGLEIAKSRPAVIQPGTLEKLNDYRGFRHVVMHRYGAELKPERIQALVEALPECYAEFEKDMQTFCEFLLQLESAN